MGLLWEPIHELVVGRSPGWWLLWLSWPPYTASSLLPVQLLTPWRLVLVLVASSLKLATKFQISICGNTIHSPPPTVPFGHFFLNELVPLGVQCQCQLGSSASASFLSYQFPLKLAMNIHSWQQYPLTRLLPASWALEPKQTLISDNS